MSESNNLSVLLTRLKSNDANERDVAAAELGDLIESDCLKAKDFQRTAKQLIAAVQIETDWSAKESMYNALSSTSANAKAAGIDWSPIAENLNDLDVGCLEHALIILGDSGNPKFKHVIRPFLHHAHGDVASTAADALKTIDWQQRRSSQSQLKSGKHR